MHPPSNFEAFRTLSARLGQDPLRVQGPGGNTSLKDGDTLWIKASGTELANAETQDIFVPVSRPAALAEARGEAGDGSCKTTVLDPDNTLRPSIETTFHAALEWTVVAHTHSIATLVHAVSPEGCAAAVEKLAGLPAVFAPYAKPGLPLTEAIFANVMPGTRVIVLQNHGLICCGNSVSEVSDLIEQVEHRLQMTPRTQPDVQPKDQAPDAYHWAAESWIARDDRAQNLALAGTYYPDHAVFLGAALPTSDTGEKPPAILVPGTGILLRNDATPSQRAMLRCLSDMLLRLPDDWTATPIGTAAEAELLDWDAEKYRQALAART